MTLENGGGTTPCQASPLMNAAATTPRVPSQGRTPAARVEAQHARQVRGALVAVVETSGGKYRRRSFLSLSAAERAVERAHEAGHMASVILCRLEPVLVNPLPGDVEDAEVAVDGQQ